MTLNRLGLAVVTTLTWTSPAATQTAAADRSALARKPEVAAALTVLDSWIAATVAQREQPGLSIGVVYDQDLIWAKGYGYADLVRRVPEIGRASCRERVWFGVRGVSVMSMCRLDRYLTSSAASHGD